MSAKGKKKNIYYQSPKFDASITVIFTAKPWATHLTFKGSILPSKRGGIKTSACLWVITKHRSQGLHGRDTGGGPRGMGVGSLGGYEGPGRSPGLSSEAYTGRTLLSFILLSFIHLRHLFHM